jgi:hypothetical protein
MTSYDALQSLGPRTLDNERGHRDNSFASKLDHARWSEKDFEAKPVTTAE